MAGLLDFLQAASNAVAGNVSGPVDLLSAGLRYAGLPIPQDAVGSTEWMKQKGLLRDVPQSASSLAGETLGLLSPLAAARAPQIARGLLAMQDAAPGMMSRGAMVPANQEGAINVQSLREAFPDVAFDLSQRGNKATLSKVVIPKDTRGQGEGTRFMRALTDAADADGALLALSPSSDFGGNKARLLDFYKRFGFIPNKGRNIDYEVSESMYRQPLDPTR